ncbi:PTS cellobiose transporter subunit IIC [Brevibacillus humidisoli]|uniref:PTS cellobiose transporter subunit IIC n=1 Tax=Brevibacillus humidisoli TaxID=2895522 RepID=UPI001E3A23CB|nr:PTS cellobiose transporter subunit IIC [Brevibacillus humidisoli]UFJ41601.1 PTS cellobiose transporter subunit IIC [Brevibacillus humidisoli]
MGGFISFLERRVMPVAGRVAEQKHLQAIRDGIILVMPLLIIGSLFLIIGFLPIPGYDEFMANTFGDQWRTKLLYPVNATFDIMALIVGFGVAYRLAEKYKVDPLSAGAIAVAAFLLATPNWIMFTPEGATAATQIDGVIPRTLMGSQGLFVSMLIAVLSTEIYRKIIQKNIVFRMPDGVPPAVSRSFVALIPAFVILLATWLLRILIENTSFESIHNIVSTVLAAPLNALGGTLIGGIVAVLVVHILWAVGIHGAAIVDGVLGAVWLTLMDQNRVVFQQNPAAELPNIITKQFFDMWIYAGGSGATLALVILMLLRARSQQMKSTGRLSIGPGLFNINEPVIFGMPIVMNPLLIIPFILCPFVLVIISYFAMSWGLVAKPSGVSVPWTTPPIISGYLATGGKISGSILQIVNIFISLLIYYPFFRLWDKQKWLEEQGNLTAQNVGKDSTAQM